MEEKFLTIAPVRSPINLFSESAPDVHALMQLIAASNGVSEMARVENIEWQFGYGSLEHDALSPLFRPIIRIVCNEKLIHQCHQAFSVNNISTDITISDLELRVYDDTVSIMIVDWDCQKSLSDVLQDPEADHHEQDARFTELTQLVAEVVNENIWQPILALLSGHAQACWRDPSKFTIFSDYNNKQGQLLWVSRVYIASGTHQNDRELIHSLNIWCGADPSAAIENSTQVFHVGSGNAYCLLKSEELVYDDILRSLCFMQFYCSVLWLYREQFAGDLVLVSEEYEAKSRNILKLVQQRLDHLDFFALEYSHSCFGTQGNRRQLIAHIAASWKTEQQFQMIQDWAAVLRARIERHLEAERRFQNRMIQGVLGVIGGLSLLDVALSIKAMSNQESDNIYGVLDLFSLISADGIIFAAIALALIIGFLVYRNH